jgi:decaprenylphospho-beta-D-ribofuranose 2-oxidase
MCQDEIQATFASRFVEITTIILFLLALANAKGQGRRWLSTLVWSAAIGLAVECYVSSRPEARYRYPLEAFWLKVGTVPVYIGLGWGLVFYAATWTAQRLASNSAPSKKGFWSGLLASSAVAGSLAVNLDLSLDPVAQAQRLWSWTTWPPKPLPVLKCLSHQYFAPLPNAADLKHTMFGVPYDNFIGWTLGVAVYGFLVRWMFRAVNRRQGQPTARLPGSAALSGEGGILYDIFVPAVAGLGAAAVLYCVRLAVPHLYTLLGGYVTDLGQTRLFATLFLVALFVSWVLVTRGARNQEPNWVILAIVAYFHLTSFGLLIACQKSEQLSSLLVLIPMNFVGGMLAYAWPSLDSLLEFKRRKDRERLGVPPMVYRTLSSYSGAKTRALVCTATTKSELLGVLAFARESGKKVTFRAGGMAFDTQSLNEQLIISLSGGDFAKISVDREHREVTVGATATWGAILKQTLKAGLVPFIMVTNSACTAGGTLSSHSLGRFSPSVGREGAHVRRFKLLTPDGDILECEDGAQSTNYQLFRSVIGGLGYIGTVLEITYRLWPLPGPDSAVETTFTLVEGLAPISTALLANAGVRFDKVITPFVRAVHDAHEGRTTLTPAPIAPRAMSAAINLRGGAWGLLADSSYVSGKPLHRSVFHSPRSLGHLLLQLAATIPWLRGIGYKLTYRAYANKPQTFVDEPTGYTFFEDGNRMVRHALQLLGIPAPVLQQTFIIPADITDPRAATEALVGFLAAADRQFQQYDVQPALIDALYVGKDAHAFVLSSSNDLAGFAVTFTFESLFRPLDAEARAMTALAKDCANVDGRVHLVKNVRAEPATMTLMYGNAIKELQTIRKARTADGVLSNEFSKRALGIY